MAALDVHFVDAATGLCVQTLQVSRVDMTAQQILADLNAHKPADRTLAFPAQGHVCATVAPTQAELDALAKGTRLRELRALGWTNLTDAQKAEARSLAFDLGLWAPA